MNCSDNNLITLRFYTVLGVFLALIFLPPSPLSWAAELGGATKTFSPDTNTPQLTRIGVVMSVGSALLTAHPGISTNINKVEAADTLWEFFRNCSENSAWEGTGIPPDLELEQQVQFENAILKYESGLKPSMVRNISFTILQSGVYLGKSTLLGILYLPDTIWPYISGGKNKHGYATMQNQLAALIPKMILSQSSFARLMKNMTKFGPQGADVLPFLHCLCMDCGSSLGGFFNPSSISGIGYGPCQCNGQAAIWKTPLPTGNKELQYDCFSKVTQMSPRKKTDLFNSWSERAASENTSTAQTEMEKLRINIDSGKAQKDRVTARRLADQFELIKNLISYQDAEYVRTSLGPLLEGHAHKEVEKGNLSRAIADLDAVLEKVGTAPGQRQKIAARRNQYQKWDKTWLQVKEKSLPKIETIFKEGQVQQARKELINLEEQMLKDPMRPLPPAIHDPAFLTLKEKIAVLFSAVEGRVDLSSGKKKAASVQVGDMVAVGDVVRTQRKSKAEIKLAESSFFSIAQRTRVRITKAIIETGGIDVQLDLSGGLIRSVVNKSGIFFGRNKKNSYEIHTPTAVCGVRGTDFFSSFQDGMSTFVFKTGKGYGYAKKHPDLVVNISPGQAMTVKDGDATPVLREISDAEINQLLKETTVARKDGNKTNNVKQTRQEKQVSRPAAPDSSTVKAAISMEEDCQTDQDCNLGYICANNKCVSPFEVDDGSYTNILISRENNRREQQISRTTVDQSQSGGNLSSNGLPGEMTSESSNPAASCREDWQCPANSRCINGVCGQTSSCSTDSDCPTGFSCRNSQCLGETVTAPTSPTSSNPPPSTDPALTANSILNNWNFIGRRRDGVTRSGTINFNSDGTHQFRVTDADNQVNDSGNGTWELTGARMAIGFGGVLSSWNGVVTGDGNRFVLDTRTGSNHGVYTFTR